MECPICFNLIQKSCVGGCMHHFCYNCLIKWINKNEEAAKCPICKEIISEIRFDKEFDLINNPNSYYEIDNLTKIFEIKSNNDTHFGITLCNNSPGVKIKKIIEKDICYKAGLRVNDIILFINNIPCINHKQSIQIINMCKEYNKNVILEIINNKV